MTYLQMTPAEKRQAVLNVLWNAIEITQAGLAFSEIKARLGATQSLTSVLNTMLMRGEIKHGRRISGNKIEWLPVADTTTQIRMGPATTCPAPVEQKREPHVRVVRLLDKPNRSSGGQCANIGKATLQSGMNGSAWL